MVTIDSKGSVQTTDRGKDRLNSGGERTSSVAFENALIAHAAVLEAAMLDGKHAKRDEQLLSSEGPERASAREW